MPRSEIAGRDPTTARRIPATRPAPLSQRTILTRIRPGPQTGHFRIDNTAAMPKSITAWTGPRSPLSAAIGATASRICGLWDYVDYEPDNDNKFFTQELRLASNAKGLAASIGSSARSTPWNGSMRWRRTTSLACHRFDSAGMMRRPHRMRYRQGELSFNDSFKVTAGLRYTDELKIAVWFGHRLRCDRHDSERR